MKRRGGGIDRDKAEFCYQLCRLIAEPRRGSRHVHLAAAVRLPVAGMGLAALAQRPIEIIPTAK